MLTVSKISKNLFWQFHVIILSQCNGSRNYMWHISWWFLLPLQEWNIFQSDFRNIYLLFFATFNVCFMKRLQSSLSWLINLNHSFLLNIVMGKYCCVLYFIIYQIYHSRTDKDHPILSVDLSWRVVLNVFWVVLIFLYV